MVTTLIDDVQACRNLYNHLLSPVCKEYDLNITSVMILLCLSENHDRTTASEIVENTHLGKSLVSMSLKDLCEKGYIKSVPSESDHRQQLLILQPASAELVDKIKLAHGKFSQILTSGFSAAEKKKISEYFRQIEQNISQYASKEIKEDGKTGC